MYLKVHSEGLNKYDHQIFRVHIAGSLLLENYQLI